MRLPFSTSLSLAMFVASAGISNPGYTSCGSAFCVLNTDWDTQGVLTEPGKAGLDLRYEFIRQNQLRAGNTNISQSQDTSDTTELKTINRNLVATLDYVIDPRWAVSASLPVVSRSHSHIAGLGGVGDVESWSFAKVGDARMLGRYQFVPEQPALSDVRIEFGLKFPTGDYKVANVDGTVAERALQPGTGSTDFILGAYYAHRAAFHGSNWFAHLLYQKPVSTKDGFRPGDQLSITGGVSYPYGERISVLFQLNGLVKQKDTGVNAEPDLSGGRYVFASPGLSYSVTKAAKVYGFVQLPLYRNVNGVQLTANWSLVSGLSLRF